MNYWLVKSEPGEYSWDDLVKLGRDHWDGVRNYQARNFLKSMKCDDLVLFYHSGEDREIVGIAKVMREYYQDPTTEDENWVVVDLSPLQKLKSPVNLAQIKKDKSMADIHLVRNSRLSVMPIPEKVFQKISKLSEA